MELNDQHPFGTPNLRLDTSVEYDDLWQKQHSLGIQYGFSPEAYKGGGQWNSYDLPLIDYYSAFYRLPLGHINPDEDIDSNGPASFGYNEATRKFDLPPLSGRTDLTLFAGRATIDSGVQTISDTIIYDVPNVRQISRQDVQEDLSTTEAMGFRLGRPLPEIKNLRSTLSVGMDFKTFSLTSYKTNIFTFTEITLQPDGTPNPPIVSSVNSPVPAATSRIEYLPWELHYGASLSGTLGQATLGLDVSGNAWYSGSTENLQNLAGSTKSSGHWVTLNPSLSWSVDIHTNWMFSARANGQWASEPLIGTEQFGAGGVNSVRGYHEGEVFGDDGWHVSVEQQTPPFDLSFINAQISLTVRGSVYTDCAQTSLIDPQGQPGSVTLWGAGFGATGSVGSHWEARVLFSLPLLSAGSVQAYQPFFNFGLVARF